MKSRCSILFSLLLLLFMAASPAFACVPGMGPDRVKDRWVTLVVEDHTGMRELIWDAAFKDLATKGPFQPDHRYVLKTTERPSLIDFGCWDSDWDNDCHWSHYPGCGDNRGPCGHRDGDNHRNACAPSPAVPSCDWLPGRTGVLLRFAGHTTWLPVAAGYDGDEFPGATFRGAYLNWLLLNRGATPAIPNETRWQRVQRGAGALAQDLLDSSHGDPHMVLVAIGTSGRLLIPPTESVWLASTFAHCMSPWGSGSLYWTLREVLDTAQAMRPSSTCLPGMVLVLSDGNTLGGYCGQGQSYENQGTYASLLSTVAGIPATGQASVWTWSVDGQRPWAQDLARKGSGSSFGGDALPALENAVRGWMATPSSPLALSLTFDQVSPTRASQVLATVTANRTLATATVNGQAMTLNGTSAQLALRLQEGANQFTVRGTDICRGVATTSASLTLDSTSPQIMLNPVPPALTSQASVILAGSLDDPATQVTLNGQLLVLDGQGRFSLPAILQEGSNAFLFRSQDPAGNVATLTLTVVRDSQAPQLTVLSPSEGLSTRASICAVIGRVDDPSATLLVNGQPVTLLADGSFTGTITLPGGDGPFQIVAVATDRAGNSARVVRNLTVDRTAPTLQVTQPSDGLVTREASLIVTGRVSEPAASLTLNGAEVSLQADGSFSAPVQLPTADGPFTLTLAATDRAGNVGSALRTLRIDRTKPSAIILDPAEGLQTAASQLTVVALVSEPAARFSLNGQAVPLQADGSASSVVTLPASDGPWVLQASAIDPAGNTGTSLRNLVVDRTPPTIVIDVPLEGTRTGATRIPVSGHVSEPVSKVLIGGKPATWQPDGSFQGEVDLPSSEGLYTIIVTATDLAGNVGTRSQIVRVDRSGPGMIIDQPKDFARLKGTEVTVVGRVMEKVVSLTVNGILVTPAADDSFTVNLALGASEGPFLITVTAQDLAGNVASTSVGVTIDRTSPEILLTAPVEGLHTRASRVTVSGRVGEAVQSLTLNGRAVVPANNGSFSLDLDLPASEGTFAIQAKATDRAGNISQATRTVILDHTPPRIQVQSPLDGLRSNAQSLTVIGSIDEPTSTFTINGKSVTPGADGSFLAVLALPASDGPFSLALAATDLAGNAGSAALAINLDRTPPVLTLSAPTEGLLTNAATLLVTGQVNEPLFALAVNGQATTPQPDGRFSLTLSLPTTDGTFSVTVVATDLAQNQSSLVRTVSLNHVAPKLTLSAPPEGYRTRGDVLLVEGSVDKPVASLFINDQAATPASDRSFRATLVLPATEGPFATTVAALDFAGNAGSFTRGIVIDRTPPRILLDQPLPSLTRHNSLSVQGRLDDPTATLVFNGQPVTLEPQGRFTLAVSLDREGANPFHLIAADDVGNAAEVDSPIVRDTVAPGLTLSAPADGLQTRALTVEVVGQVDDPTASVTLNGLPVTPLADGRFTATVNLLEGSFVLTVRALDPAGNETQVQRTLRVDRTAPTINLIAPLPSLTNKPSLVLQGSVNKALATLTLNGQTVALDAQGAFLTSFTLSEGENLLNFQATDALGNQGSLSGSVTLDTVAPVVNFLTPVEGWSTNQRTLTLTGRVDDPTARLAIAGQTVVLDPQGGFSFSYPVASEGPLAVLAMATDPAGNAGFATRNLNVIWTAPLLAWADPTPAEGALLANPVIPVAATLAKADEVTLNGIPLTLQAGPSSTGGEGPYTVATTVTVAEGPALLSLVATDAAGNTSRIQRHLDVGTSLPQVVLEGPAEGAQTREATTTLQGHVEFAPFTAPIQLTLNGALVVLGADGRFSLPVALLEGTNTFTVLASNRFGLQGRAVRSLSRFTTPPTLTIDWPLTGWATPEASLSVRGRVQRAGTTVRVNGVAALVNPTSLGFTATVPLQAGANTLTAVGTDLVGNTGTASVQVTSTPGQPQAATYRWDSPVDGSASPLRTVSIAGLATLPDVASVDLNGQTLTVAGTGAAGSFSGTTTLSASGRNALVLQVTTLAGQTFTERREVVYQPALPNLTLSVPDSARPGDLIAIAVAPAAGTQLAKAEVSWNGRALATVQAPWVAIKAQVPGDAVIGSQIPVQVLGTDDQGTTVTARTVVTVYGSGALVVEAYDDSTGLLLTDQKATATLDGVAQTPLDAHGKVALATALPENWVRVQKPGFLPVWRSAGLTVGSAQAAVDVRLVPLAETRTTDANGYQGAFGGGAVQVFLPSTALPASTGLSMTPLSIHGLPGLLPAGWSAMSAWWLDLGGQALAVPGTAGLNLPLTLAPGSPALPGNASLVWVHWDPVQHAWVVLSAPLTLAELGQLTLPSEGGYALLMADPAPTAPPAPVGGAILPGFEGTAWLEGLTASGSISPSVLSTVAAINGAKALAGFQLTFEGKGAIPSATLIQTDILESYTLLDQSVIEPDGCTQDLVASRWMLEVVDGAPVLTGLADGIGLHVPVHMSRSFDPAQLVEGRILVGFYHDGVKLAESGSELVGPGGGTISQGGINVILGQGAVTGTTLVRVAPDRGDPALLWPELAGQGTILSSFHVSIVGTLQSGLGVSLDTLAAAPGTRTLLVQRRSVQGQALVVAVGELKLQGGQWLLVVPSGGNPVLEGGAFAALALPGAWDWVAGTTVLPAPAAQAMVLKLGAKTGLASMVRSASSPANPAPATVADVALTAGLTLAVSGGAGSFAVPAPLPGDCSPVTIRGSRYDLGLAGSLTASVPSVGNTLTLDVRPFIIETLTPAEAAQVGPGQVLILATSTAMDPASLTGIHLLQLPADGSSPLELAITQCLSQDGRTLFLTPKAELPLGTAYRLTVEGLQGLAGGAAAGLERHFRTAAQPVIPDVDLTLIRASYPDATQTVTVTIPQGAVAPWSMVEVSAPGMGSVGTGMMPPQGHLSFQMKAALGEQLTVTVQLRDGRICTGTIGRYVAEDGRTTLGVDGGRVEGPGGLAIVVPVGALNAATELQVEALSAAPAVAEGALRPGEKTVPGLRIRAALPVTFQVPPQVEIPVSALPAGLALQPRSDGNGPVALFRSQTVTLPDGSLDISHILMDTLQVSEDGRILRGLGGLRVPDPQAGLLLIGGPVALASPVSAPVPADPLRVAAPKTAALKVQATAVAAPKVAAMSLGNIQEVLLDVFLLGMPADTPPEYFYNSGTVYRNWNALGTCSGQASATCYGFLPGAEVHRWVGSLGLAPNTMGRLASGRLLATCDRQGRYLSVGGPDVTNVVPGQDFIALFGVDPRTGETSLDPGAPSALSLGFEVTGRQHSLAITSSNGNPFDPALTAPRLVAKMVDAKGTARTVFAVGDTATLQLSLAPQSQPVVRGTLTGALKQAFNALPQAIPVTFDQVGTWHVEVNGWNAKGVQGVTSLNLTVTEASLLGPSLPGAPTITSREPAAGDTDVEPVALIKVAFSEPVLPAPGHFAVTVNGVPVEFTLLGNGQVLTGSTPAQEVWILPKQALMLGAKVGVMVHGLPDLDSPKPGQLVPDSWSFTVRGALTVGTLTDAQQYTALAIHQGTGYAIERSSTEMDLDGVPMQAIRVIDLSTPSSPKLGDSFGCHGSWTPKGALYRNGWADNEPFYRHTLTGLRVAPGVILKGQRRDLLLVLSRPNLTTEVFVKDSDGDNTYRTRHNAVWVFDITGDAAARGENGTPKLLMCSSLGTQSENWGTAVGSVAGMLGVIRLRGGLSLWDGSAWARSLVSDGAALEASRAAFDGLQVLARRTRTDQGYFPDPTSLMASNGFYDPAQGAPPSVVSAIFTANPKGLPMAYAAMGYSEGYLMAVDLRVGGDAQPGEAKATFRAGGPMGLDNRLQDLSAAVQREPVTLLETLSGAWQGPSGSEQGTLLLAGTSVSVLGQPQAHFWVLRPTVSAAGVLSLVPYGYVDLSSLAAMAQLPAATRVTRINVDPKHMLVGVEAGGEGWIFDLKTLVSASVGPMPLQAIYRFPVTGAWTLSDGLLVDDQILAGTEPGSTKKQLVAKTLEQRPQQVALPVRIDIVPPVATVLAKGTLTFQATTSGALSGPVEWKVQEDAGGTVSPAGTYQAPTTLGRYTVRATLASHPSAFAEATVTVADVALEPQTADLLAGDVLPIQVKGNPGAPSGSSPFSATAGTISPTGVYTAPVLDGPVRVTYQNQARTATACLTIHRGRGLAISPDLDLEQAGDYAVEVTLTGKSGRTSFASARFTVDGTGPWSPEVWFSAAQLQADLAEDGPYAVSEVVLVLEERDDRKVMARAVDLGSTRAVKLGDLNVE